MVLLFRRWVTSQAVLLSQRLRKWWLPLGAEGDPFVRLGGAARSFDVHYQICQRLATTEFGSVHVCCTVASPNRKLVVKVVPKERHPLLRMGRARPSRFSAGDTSETEEFLNFMQALLRLRNQHVVRYLQFLADEKSYYFVMEYCCGRPLQGHLLTRSGWREEDVEPILRQLLLALKYVHSNGLLHRDIKLENVFVSDDGKNLKLLDFGLGCRSTNARGVVGTTGYTAPEIFGQHSYGCTVDIFSAGVVFHVCLSGRPAFRIPMDLRSIEERLRLIYQGPDLSWAYGLLSREGHDLLLRMLDPHPMRRYSADEALQHTWFRQRRRGLSTGGGPVLWHTSESDVQFLQVMGVWSGSFSRSSSGVADDLQPLGTIAEDDVDEDALVERSMSDGIIQNMLWSVTVADPSLPDCPLVAVSRGFEVMTGWSRNEAIGKNCRFLNQRDGFPDELRKQLREAVQARSTFLGILPNVRRDGTPFSNMLHLSPIRVGNRTYLIGLQWQVNPDGGSTEINLQDSQQAEEIHRNARQLHSSVRRWVQAAINKAEARRRRLSHLNSGKRVWGKSLPVGGDFDRSVSV